MADVGTILVVGAGLAGLAAAAALDRQGFRVHVVERRPAWRVPGAGLAVQPNAMRVLDRFGVADRVLSAGAPIRSWEYADHLGECLCRTDLTELWSDISWSMVGIGRSTLQQILRDETAGIPIRFGLAVADLQEHERDVQVSFADGSCRAYDLVIGADGIHSTVRDLTIGVVTPEFTGQIAWRTLAHLPRTTPSPFGVSSATAPDPTIRFHLGSDRFFGLCPVGGGLTYGFGNVRSERTDDPVAGRLERLRERFGTFGSAVTEFLEAVRCDEQVHCSVIECIELPRWHTERVVLIGDAAHAAAPMLGQGGCLAIEDGWVLAQVLRVAPTVTAGLRRYEARRRPRVDWVQQQSRTMAQSLRSPVDQRVAALRTDGDRLLRQRLRPLLAEP